MNRQEFEALMDADAWHPHQRLRWEKITPVCDAATFRREMSRPDGCIQVEFDKDNRTGWLRFKMFWEALGRVA